MLGKRLNERRCRIPGRYIFRSAVSVLAVFIFCSLCNAQDGVTYKHKPSISEAKETDYHYNSLASGIIEQRGIHRFDEISFIPFMAAGWNPRPWWQDKRATFTMPTKAQWTRELTRMAYDLDNLSNMGIKLDDGTKQKIFTIYAWNEFGEGGIVAPTQGDKYMKLEGIKEVFGVKLRK